MVCCMVALRSPAPAIDRNSDPHIVLVVRAGSCFESGCCSDPFGVVGRTFGYWVVQYQTYLGTHCSAVPAVRSRPRELVAG